MRVAAGAVAKKYLSFHYGISVRGYLAQMGSIAVNQIDWAIVNDNPFFCPDPNCIAPMEALIDELRRAGDSVGARINVIAEGVMPGLGEPVFDRLDAELAKAMMSINAVKGVEVGDGFSVVEQRGSEHRDEIRPEGFLSNHSGGVLGGISTGQDICVSLALKPTSSITQPGRSVNRAGEPVDVVTKGRHDPCVGVRATPIAEAMMALVLMDHLIRYRGQVSELDRNE